MNKNYTFLILLCCLFRLGAWGQAPIIKYDTLTTGLSLPLDVASPADGSGRVFIVQQGGAVRIWTGSTLVAEPFMNLSAVIRSGGEQGLLSMAFHPQYATNRYFFVYYTRAADGALTIARYWTQENNPNSADMASGVEILVVPHPNNTNHNGGKLNFGKDGFLYVGTGDGGGGNDVPNNAQNGLSLLGKMLRINVNDFGITTPPRYTIPATNPYINNAAVADEVIALGLRNPFRWSFDRQTGDMWIGDVGQSAREEVSYRAAADISSPTNYGWRCKEGTITNPNASYACPDPPNYVPPVFDYPRNAAGGYVITGGYVYRGPDFPALQGYYICTDYSTGNIWLLGDNGQGGWAATAQTVNLQQNIAGFGEGENGALYAVRLRNGAGTANSGVLYKVVVENPLPVRLVYFTAKVADGMHRLQWQTSSFGNVDSYKVERSSQPGTGFEEVASLSGRGAESSFETAVAATSYDAYYRLKTIMLDGQAHYSSVVRLAHNTAEGPLFTAYISGNYIALQLQKPAREIRLLSTGGEVLYKRALNGQSGNLQIPLDNIPKMIMLLQVSTEHGSEVKKLAW